MNSSVSQATEAVARAFDALATRHDQGLASADPLQSSLYHAATWQAICEAVAGRPLCSVLDLGGGNGLWTERLMTQGHRVVYVDCSFQMAQLAYSSLEQRALVTNVVLGDAQCLGFLPSGLFDVILAVGDLISYVADPLLVCAECYRCCKPGGKLIVSCMGRYGVLPYVADTLPVEDVCAYILDGAWTEFQAYELGTQCRQSLAARAYTTVELAAISSATGWQIEALFGAGILRTLLGRDRLAELIRRYGMTPILGLERQLAQASLLDCAMEYGMVNAKPIAPPAT